MDTSQQDIPINPTPMHGECIGNLIINKIIHCHFHHFHADNLADGNSHRTNKFPDGTINANPSWDAICQWVPMQQTLAVGITKTQVEEVPTMGIRDHTNTSTNTLPQGVYFADASGIVHTETEPLQGNTYCNHNFDTSELFFSDPYSNTEENYHAQNQQNDDNPITPDQNNEYDTIAYEERYSYLNEQHHDECS